MVDSLTGEETKIDWGQIRTETARDRGSTEVKMGQPPVGSPRGQRWSLSQHARGWWIVMAVIGPPA